jgi:hypothetical protein
LRARADGVDEGRREGVHRGGRPRKEHPGLALREAARLIANESWWSTSTVASKVTEMVLDRLSEDDLGSHRWTAFTRDDADQMRCAIAAKLVKCTTAEGLLVRENPTGVFRTVDDLQWLPIPRPA